MGVRKGLLNLYSRCVYYTAKHRYYNIILLLLDHLLSLFSLITIFPLDKQKSVFPVMYKINPKCALDGLNNLTNPTPIRMNSTNTTSSEVKSFFIYTNILIYIVYALSILFFLAVLIMFFRRFRFEKVKSAWLSLMNKVAINGFYLFFNLFSLFIYGIFLNKILILINISYLSYNAQLSNQIFAYITIFNLVFYLCAGVIFFNFFASPFPVFKLHVDNFNRVDFLFNFLFKLLISPNNSFQDHYSILIFKFGIIIFIFLYLLLLMVKVKEKFMSSYSIINLFYFLICGEIIVISFYNLNMLNSVTFPILIEEFFIVVLANVLIFFHYKENVQVVTLDEKHIFNDIYRLTIMLLNSESEEANKELVTNIFHRHKFLCQSTHGHCVICNVDVEEDFNVYKFFYKILYEKSNYHIKKTKIMHVLLKLMLTFKIDEQKIHRISIFIQRALKDADLRLYLQISYFYNFIKNLNEKESLVYKISLKFFKIYEINNKLIENLITFIKRLVSKNVGIDEILKETTELGNFSEILTNLNDYNERNKKIFTMEVDMIMNFLLYKFVFNQELKNFEYYNIFDNPELGKILTQNFNESNTMIIRFDTKMNIWKIKYASHTVLENSKFSFEHLLDKNFDFLFPGYLFPDGLINEYFSNLKEDNVSFKSYFIDKENFMHRVKLVLKYIPSLKGENLIVVNIDFYSYKPKKNNCLIIVETLSNQVMSVSKEFTEMTSLLPKILKKVKKLTIKDLFGVNFEPDFLKKGKKIWSLHGNDSSQQNVNKIFGSAENKFKGKSSNNNVIKGNHDNILINENADSKTEDQFLLRKMNNMKANNVTINFVDFPNENEKENSEKIDINENQNKHETEKIFKANETSPTVNSIEKKSFSLKLSDLASNIYNIQCNSDTEVIHDNKRNIYIYMIERIPNVSGSAEIEMKPIDSFMVNRYLALKVKFLVSQAQRSLSIRKRPIVRNNSESVMSVNTVQHSVLSNHSMNSYASSRNVLESRYNKILLNIPEYKMTENSINNSILDRIVHIISYLNIVFLLIAIIFIVIIQAKLDNLTVFFKITTNFQILDTTIYNLIINVNDLLAMNVTDPNMYYNNPYFDQLERDGLFNTDIYGYIIKEMGIKLNDIVAQTNVINTILTSSLNQSIIDNHINFPVKYWNLFRDGRIVANNYSFLDALNYFNNELIILSGTSKRYYNMSSTQLQYVDENNVIFKNFWFNKESVSIYNVIFNYFTCFYDGFNKINAVLINILYDKLSSFVEMLYYFLSVICLGNIISIIFTIIAIKMYITRINSAINFIFSLESSHFNYLLKKFELIKEILTSKSCPTTNFREIKDIEEDYFNSISSVFETKISLAGGQKKNANGAGYTSNNTGTIRNTTSSLANRNRKKEKTQHNYNNSGNNGKNAENSSLISDSKKTIIDKENFHMNKDKEYSFRSQKEISVKTYVLLAFYAVFIVGIFFLESILMDNIYTVIKFKSNFLNIEKKYIINVLSLQYLVILNSTSFLNGDYKNRVINVSFFEESAASIYNSLSILKELETKTIFHEFYNNETLFQGEGFCDRLFSNPDYITDSYKDVAELYKDLIFLCKRTPEMNSDIQTILSFMIRESRKLISSFDSKPNRNEAFIVDFFNNSEDINKLNVMVVLFLRRYFYFFSRIVDSAFNNEISAFFVNHILVFMAILLYDCISLVLIKFLILDKIVVSIHHTKNIMSIIKH